MQRIDASGFIMPDGEFVALENVERMYTVAVAALDSPAKVAAAMLDLALDCDRRGRPDTAEAYFRKAIDLTDDDLAKAYCFLNLGRLKEKADDHPGAIAWYAKAFWLEPGTDETWYFLHNNMGYSLNELGRHREGEAYCRGAIAIDPHRHNAWKNLGIALEGLGRHADAAAAWLEAATLCPEDRRAMQLLEALAARRPHIAPLLQTAPRHDRS
jgi:tetratricopeptide (TPR) repeat protein